MSRLDTIAELNDRFRSQLGMPCFGNVVPGRIMFTRGIMELPPEAQIDIWMLVRNFDAFTEDNDPYGEHDFGSLDHPVAGKVFWKIDYYDPSYTAGSEDPADPVKTRRVLTLMLAEEY
ncbi:MAG: DUF3768 domain-containing protein [Hyphomicrobiales bacterium]|nr:DUF3768 domain-containing protein [Hyphomicrobiales bacterium]